ncbi:hypothetical protein UFOVP1290_228 [uncultured Caudovirales phage]|uniref:Uncharacterized protein n=1 Tax=uncultured Caudovirales phage TaxID=2100421 RepID=A0A6J5RSZ1_9CAUD|nr:hypothetical protein UFOVP1290_228 [uncultured Caudovirales phage]
MAYVYVLEYSYPYDCANNVTIWDSKDAAYKQAAHDIQYTIRDSWDMTDATECKDAKEINDMIKCGDYEGAVYYFNRCDSNEGDRYESWSVSDQTVRSNATTPSVFSDDYFESDEDDDDCDSDECDCEDKSKSEEVYQATESGATCRGPCGGYNEYTYADKRDGTFICYACKMMAEAFKPTS